MSNPKYDMRKIVEAFKPLKAEPNKKASHKMKYGDKRDYPKIDLYINGKYVCSTNWSKTLKDAKQVYADKNKINPKAIKAEYSK